MAKETAVQQDEQPEEATSLLEGMAFDLYTARRSSPYFRQTPEQSAKECFRDAEAFIAVAGRVRSGESVQPAPTSRMADCSAPNLKPTHPVNLVSQRFGNLKLVKEINDRLQANEKLETIPEYEWGIPEVNQARVLFPAYANN